MYRPLLIILLLLPVLTLSSFARRNVSRDERARVQIVLAYSRVKEWTERAQAAPAMLDRRQLFQQIVLAPVRQKCFPEASEEDSLRQLEGTIGNPASWDLDLVRREISALNSQQSELLNLLRATFSASHQKLQTSAPISVCVFYFSPYWGSAREKFNGSFGFTPSATSIQLFVAPVGPWLHWAPAVFAHEYHHAAWLQLNPGAIPSAFDLLDELIFEGRADEFAREVTQLKAPWTDAVTPNQACKIFEALSADLYGTKLTWYGLNHDRTGRFPEWAGYTIASRIMRTYLRGHPSMPILSWTMLPAKTLLEQSGYSAHCGEDKEATKQSMQLSIEPAVMYSTIGGE